MGYRVSVLHERAAVKSLCVYVPAWEMECKTIAIRNMLSKECTKHKGSLCDVQPALSAKLYNDFEKPATMSRT
jgi:hypothetical protein